MKRLQRAALAALLALPGLAWADFSGKVVAVKDGDTVEVLRNGVGVRVRMTGIDAPEKRQAYGDASKRHLGDAVFGRVVRIEERGTDRYQRVLGRVLLGGEDINLRQIRDGYAWHYAQYSKNQPAPEAERYAAVERLARQERRGLWREPAPVPPWEFRRKRR